ncbi:endocuticle structural glycoprotein ABD-5-like [Pararge aegeria]|uniref:Jg9501 protein n=1 Tax=Pararge aegeria aegeria TaxID=348720 RepID=A0A8S4RKA5_9NEOP|nr:endocuticle structural glycoprotein ABD-5-like [Pararge aegeria]CAH2237009.1 jg9501 [Pararge aegeria aegeria]
MLKYVTVVCVLAALCAGAPQNPQDVQILRFDSDVQPDGYSFAYETSDGTSRQEQGKIDNPQSEDAALSVTGEYAYIAPDGKQYKVVFTADTNGYRPKTTLGQK